MAILCFLVLLSLSCGMPATATAFLYDQGQDLCCWVESVESFRCLAYLMVWRWQKPSACIKADISPRERERAARERELQYKLTMAAPVFFIFIAPSRCQPQQSLCPLWHPMAAPLHRMKEKRGGGGGSCRLGLGTWIQSWGAVGSSGVKVFSGEFLMLPTSWLFPDFSSASAEMSSTQFCQSWLRCSFTFTGHTQLSCIIPFREAHPTGKL